MDIFLGVVFLLALGTGAAECGRYISERRNDIWNPDYLRRRLNRRLTVSVIIMVEVVLSWLPLSQQFLTIQSWIMLGGIIWMFWLLRSDMRDTRLMAREMQKRLQEELLES